MALHKLQHGGQVAAQVIAHLARFAAGLELRQHLLGVEVQITPLSRIDDERWRWHVGLDAEATALLTDLYEGREVDSNRRARLISLFALRFAQPAQASPEMAGRPVYLALCRTADGQVRLKPQNLLVNLPVATPA